MTREPRDHRVALEATMPNSLYLLPALAMNPLPAPPAGQVLTQAVFPVSLVGELELDQDADRPTGFSPPALTDRPVAMPSLTERVSPDFMQVRRHRHGGALAGGFWSVTTERRRARADGQNFGDRSRRRAFTVDAELGQEFPDDQLVAHFAAELDKRPDRFASGDQASAKTRTLAAGIGWSHAGIWRLDFGLRSTTSQARSPVARLIDLASGSRPAIRQAEAKLTLAPHPLGGGKTMTIGAQASVGQLAGFDRTLAGSDQPRDNRGSLFARIAF